MEAEDWRALLSASGYWWDDVGFGASERDLAELATWFGRPLPQEYAAFLRLSNGTVVAYQDLWEVRLFSTDQIPQYARDRHILPANLPGGKLFGTTLDLYGLVFDARSHHPDGQYPVLAIDWIEVGNGWRDAIFVADDFRSMLTLQRPLLLERQITRAGMTNDYAFVAVELQCPYCRAKVSDWVLFQWGYCPRHTAYPSEVYHLGDPIEWKRCPDGSIRNWAYFAEGEFMGTIQIGDPTIKHLITRDVTQFSIDPTLHPRPCATCGRTLEGAAVEIRDGMIRRAWIYEPGDFDPTTRDFLIEPDGTLTPMPEWVKHPLETVRDCV